MFQTAALRPAYQTPLSIHKHLVPDDVRLMSIPRSQTALLSRQMGYRKPWMQAHRIFTVAAARVGGLLWPNTGPSVPASATSGDHDLLVVSWWEAVREKKSNNWCLMRALNVTKCFSKLLTPSCTDLGQSFSGRNRPRLLMLALSKRVRLISAPQKSCKCRNLIPYRVLELCPEFARDPSSYC